MMSNKSGFPEEGELVLCTITSVQNHSVFVRIEEYGISGMIHISEVAPGRIRNIRDYVMEGKSVITKVLRINRERGHVDLSLRRVSEGQRRTKTNEIKKEKMAAKLIESVASNLKADPKKLYKTIADKVSDHYYLIFECFSDVSKGTFDLKQLNLPKNLSDELQKVISDRLKPEFFTSKGKLKLTSTAPDGLEIVKSALKKAVDSGAKVRYLGGGVYSLSATAASYKDSEELLEKSASSAIKFMEANKSDGELLDAEA